ncbi:restriction endonuclease subunit S [Microbacterium sp. MEC084]|uniref:restriction endonuclease subunit S n=1 Tax=Microbacterium sp. MEC084 TaxID=1963027 RepID=UPI001E4373CF|nr:restriction endonuclease subunit S [Microbacterium sp. MEC084]MCD1268585.1 restriction endonuclease subunit S [Microbacterium sp. MEC084]
MTRLKDVAEILAGQSPPSDQVDPLDSGLPFLQGNAEFGPRHPSARYECDIAPKRAIAGDVLVSVRAPVGAVNVADRAFGIGRGLCAVRAHSIDPGYLWWWIQSTRSELESRATGSTFTAITSATLGSLELPDIPAHRQGAIADYLDRETAQIDTLIAKQTHLVSALRDRRREGIRSLVTRGLDPSAEFRANPLPWADAIPAHWHALNIRRVAAMKTGHTPSRSNPEYWENTIIPWFTLADVWQLRDESQTYLGDTANTISELGLANSAAELLPAGTVVLSRTASVGFTGVMPQPMATSQDFWNWVCGPRLLPEYLMYVFRAMRPHLLSLMIGSTHKTIYQPIAAAIRIPLPPVDEQKTIVAEIERQTAKIDALIAKAQQFIALAKERRAALITAAVTGQIDVTTGKTRAA